MDQQWCIENQELAIEYFKERQTEHSNWENCLRTSRETKSELDELYWHIRGLIKKFNDHYNEAISTKKELENLDVELRKGAVSEEKTLQRKGQLTTKLTQSFQSLVSSHEEIKNKIPAEIRATNSDTASDSKDKLKHEHLKKEVEKENQLKSVQELKEAKEPCEKEREKIRRERDIAKSDCQKLRDERDAILLELDDETMEMLRSKGVIKI